MVDLATRLLASPEAHGGRKAAAAVYEQLSRGYAAMPRDGCTDAQDGQAKALAAITHELAADVASLPDASGAQGRNPQANATSMRFMSRLEEFEKRRTAMQRDLERMRAVRLR